MNKTLLSILSVAVVVGAGAFYGGMKYDQSTAQANLSQMRANRTGGGDGGARGGQGEGFTNGNVISKDDKSITVQMRTGGSKIVFFSGGTQIMKSIAGSLSDLAVGDQVTANGSANSDGSITAQSIQIRPAMPTSTPSSGPQGQ